MKPAPFAYFDPFSVEDAVSLLAEHGADAKLLAGGQSLMPLLNMRLARPAVLVDLNRIDGLAYIREQDGYLAIGAMTRQREVERSELVREQQPLLHAATRFIAHPQIRNRGTIAGSLAHADPAAEYPAAALALDAQMIVAGWGGTRAVQAGDFFVTYLTTCLAPDEVVTEVRFPRMQSQTGWSFVEMSRRHGDFALAGVAATLTLSERGVCFEARIALFGVAPTAVRAVGAEALVRGERPHEGLFEEAAHIAGEAIDEPLADIHATSEYRRHLVRVLTLRALTEAATRAEGIR